MRVTFLCLIAVFFSLDCFAPNPVIPPVPPEFHIDNHDGISPQIYRTAERYVDQLEKIAGPHGLIVFPGRSFTTVGIIAEARGLRVLTLPLSGLGEIPPNEWNDPTNQRKLELYKSLVAEEISRELAKHPTKVVMADTVYNGGTFDRFPDLIRPMLGETPLELAALPTTDIQPEGRELIKRVKPHVLTINPNDYGASQKEQVAVDLYYYNQVAPREVGAKAASVQKFDVLAVDLGNPASVADYRRRYHDRSNPLHQKLKDYMGRLEEALTPSLPFQRPSDVHCPIEFKHYRDAA